MIVKVPIKNILCPIDFSDKSKMVIDHAVKVSELYDAQITMLNVVDDLAPEYSAYRKSSSEMQALRRTLEQDSQNRFQTQIAPKLSAVKKKEMLTAFGKSTDLIVRTAREKQAGAIMMATRSMGLTNQFILGSTTYKIVRTAPCPLIVFSKPELKFRTLRILFPTDFSELSLLSLPYVTRFALDYGSDVHLVHHRQTHGAHFKDVTKELEGIRRNLAVAGIPSSRSFINDDIKGLTPGAAILKYAKDNQIDFIVLSSHGISGYKQFFLGTTAVEVSSRSEVPVFVIRKTDWSIA